MVPTLGTASGPLAAACAVAGAWPSFSTVSVEAAFDSPDSADALSA